MKTFTVLSDWSAFITVEGFMTDLTGDCEDVLGASNLDAKETFLVRNIKEIVV